MSESRQERLERLRRERDEMNAKLRGNLGRAGLDPGGIVFGFGELDDAEGSDNGTEGE